MGNHAVQRLLATSEPRIQRVTVEWGGRTIDTQTLTRKEPEALYSEVALREKGMEVQAALWEALENGDYKQTATLMPPPAFIPPPTKPVQPSSFSSPMEVDQQQMPPPSFIPPKPTQVGQMLPPSFPISKPSGQMPPPSFFPPKPQGQMLPPSKFPGIPTPSPALLSPSLGSKQPMPSFSPGMEGFSPFTQSVSRSAPPGYHLDTKLVQDVQAMLSTLPPLQTGHQYLIRFYSDDTDVQSKAHQLALPEPTQMPRREELLQMALSHMYEGKTGGSPFVSFTEDIVAFINSVSHVHGADVSASVRSIVHGGMPGLHGQLEFKEISRPPAQYIGVFQIPKDTSVSWQEVALLTQSKPKTADLKKNFIPEKEVVAYSPGKLPAPVKRIENPYYKWFMEQVQK